MMPATPVVILLRLFASLMAVVQQPVTLPAYVSVYNVTQFETARERGSIGLLAHETGQGRMFEDVSKGNLIAVTLSDGTEQAFVVSEIYHATALEWGNPYSDFMVDGEQLTSTQLFQKVFRLNTLTLQTCEGRAGRLFILARQIEK